MSLGLLLIPLWLQRWVDGTLPPRFPIIEEPRGPLALPSGKIAVWGLTTDGSLMLVVPYTRKAPTGTYELVCGMLRGRVAFAAMRFSTASVASWEGAQWDFEGILDPRGRSVFKRTVDGVEKFSHGNGNACFVDAVAAAEHDAWRRGVTGKIAHRLLQAGKRDAEFLAAYKAAYKAANGLNDPMDPAVDLQRSVELAGGGNAITVRPGHRAAFSSFFGLDDQGSPAVFVTDFQMIHIAPPLARAPAVLEAWERDKLVEIARYARRDPFLAALAEQLDAIDRATPDGLTAELAEWLFDRSEVADVHGVDAALRTSIETVDKQLITAALGAGALA